MLRKMALCLVALTDSRTELELPFLALQFSPVTHVKKVMTSMPGLLIMFKIFYLKKIQAMNVKRKGEKITSQFFMVQLVTLLFKLPVQFSQ